ncbi:MAG: ABC transporter ATP-binding protein [Candidatus Aminicenantales bacterium]
MSAVIVTEKLSKWYGNVLGLSDVSLEIEPGITGLLGPNGAGKSTFLKLLTAQLRPSIGSVKIWGQRVRNNPALFSRIGFCPEHDAFYEEMTGWEFLTRLLRLHGFSQREAEARAEKTLYIVDLEADQDRLIQAYSRGMRQRLKVAQAIAHDPEVIILDEPLSGMDPLGKRKLIRLIKNFKSQGKTIIVSSHVLPEIEALTRTIILIHQGKVFAQGDVHYIRDLIESHPHQISIRCTEPRRLATLLLSEEDILKVMFGGDDRSLVVETRNRDKFFNSLLTLIVRNKIEVDEITSADDNLQAVFDYLVGK